MGKSEIVRAAIHPAIGIARIGDSDEYFIGPELPGEPALPSDGLRDATGRLKKQAARFRIYGYDADGHVVEELTASSKTKIEWEVEVANTKAAWYDFELAMDIPQAEAAARRNPSIAGAQRAQLEIRPTPKKISGCNAGRAAHALDDGQFMGKCVPLGALHTDDRGRLVFTGGSGLSASYDGRPVSTFANNDGWHDDVSDGPVRARVQHDGRDIPVDPAWVVCAPPNYGPEFTSIVTLYDLLTETMIQAGWATPSKSVSFRRDILPIFERTARIQWLNAGFFTQFGSGGPQDFLRPELLQRLASEDPQENELRRQVFNAFRSPEYDDRQRLALPWIYGDGMELPASNNRQWMAIPPHMYDALQRWSEGKFVADLEHPTVSPNAIGKVAIREQPGALDRAALEFCLADAFHPGCEVTWPIRHASMFMGPYRILHRSGLDPEPDYGDELEPAAVYAGGWSKPTSIYGTGTPGGPLWGQRAGGLTRWMAVPWQTDTASCRDGYDAAYDEYVPTFWPARVPNQVLAEDDYETLMDKAQPKTRRLAAYRNREEWLRVLPGGYLDQIRRMVDDFSDLGVVLRQPGPDDAHELGIPEQLYVEALPSHTRQKLQPDAGARARLAKQELRAVEKAAVGTRRQTRKAARRRGE
ncbi:MAG: LodA/GoxA family CTQ-dependent oxidase [Myxococcales bacterium]|nr:LodA/GoxA family CTQ-dependent oxidase [Myxococcales bacterium]